MITKTDRFGIVVASNRQDPTRPSSQGRQSRVGRLIAYAAVMLSTAVSAGAEAPLDTQSRDAANSSPPSSLFNAISKDGDLMRDGLTIGGPFVDRGPVTSGGPEYAFTEYLSWQQLRLTFDLRVIHDREPILMALRAVRRTLTAACDGQNAHHLTTGERIDRVVLSQPYDALMSDVFPRLFDEGLIGTFECAPSRKGTSPRISVSWETGNRRPTEIIPAHEWRFLVEYVDRNLMRAHQSRFEEHRRKVDALRSRPSVGVDVQVIADDLPTALLSRFKQPLNRQRLPYPVCGLITEVRGPLVQVQIQSETVMLPAQKIFPFSASRSADEMWRLLDAKAPLQSTCLK